MLKLHPSTGYMAPFHYQNFLGVMLVIAMGILRSKIFQNCLVLQGKGSNGKSALLSIISDVFSNKCVNIKSAKYFNGDEINMEVDNIEENMILMDQEAKCVDLIGFKKLVADKVKSNSRAIYKNPKDTISKAFIILSTNKGLRYMRDKEDKSVTVDESFLRRVYQCIIYNKVGIKNIESLIQKNKYDLKNKLVKDRIKKGFLFYLLDVIHVFNLPSLSGSNSQYIHNSISTKRNLAHYNYEIINLIYKHYIPYGEIAFNESDVLKKQNQFT
jgi:hypothetical protein